MDTNTRGKSSLQRYGTHDAFLIAWESDNYDAAHFNFNRPYSYSHGCTGNEHEREADAGKSFQMQIISPAWASIECSFQSNRENTNKVYCQDLLRRSTVHVVLK